MIFCSKIDPKTFRTKSCYRFIIRPNIPNRFLLLVIAPPNSFNVTSLLLSIKKLRNWSFLIDFFSHFAFFFCSIHTFSQISKISTKLHKHLPFLPNSLNTLITLFSHIPSTHTLITSHTLQQNWHYHFCALLRKTSPQPIPNITS